MRARFPPHLRYLGTFHAGWRRYGHVDGVRTLCGMTFLLKMRTQNGKLSHRKRAALDASTDQRREVEAFMWHTIVCMRSCEHEHLRDGVVNRLAIQFHPIADLRQPLESGRRQLTRWHRSNIQKLRQTKDSATSALPERRERCHGND